jgi:flagellar biosynthesis component FlhA
MENVTSVEPSLTLKLSRSLVSDQRAIEEGLQLLQEFFFNELGIICPSPVIREGTDLPDPSFQVQINDLQLEPTAGLDADEFVASRAPSELAALLSLPAPARPTVNPNTGDEFSIVPGISLMPQIQGAGISTWDHRGFIAFHVAAAVRKNAALLLDGELVQHYLNRLQATHPVLVRAVHECFDEGTLLELLRQKLQAQASIKNMPAVLDELLESTLRQ